MKLPFVSRERFEQEQCRSQKLEAELEKLREILIPQLRAAPADALLKSITADADLSKIQPIQGKPTIALVMADANREAYRRAQVPGAKGVAEELAEKAQGLMQRRAANGD
jgi:hypothetical protein